MNTRITSTFTCDDIVTERLGGVIGVSKIGMNPYLGCLTILWVTILLVGIGVNAQAEDVAKSGESIVETATATSDKPKDPVNGETNWSADDEAAASAQPAGGSVSSDTYDIAKKTLSTDSQAVKDKIQEYRLNRTSIDNKVVYNVQTGRDIREEGRAFKGTDPRVLLKGAKFYSHIGEKGLARWYHGKTVLRHVFRWGGIATMLGGMYWTGKGWFDANKADMAVPKRTWVIGGSMVGVGLIAWITGSAMDHDIRSVEEKGELSREHNRKLRERLGLTEEEVSLRIDNDPIMPGTQKNIRKLRWALAPAVTDTAAGLSFAMVF